MNLTMPEVETKRLYLRGLEEEDVVDIFEYCSLPETMRYVSGPKHKDIDFTLRLLRAFYLPYKRRNEPQVWCLVDQEKEKVIGHMYFHEVSIDQAQLAYMLHPAYWGKGYMHEALPELLQVGFSQLELRRITAMVAVSNVRSQKLLESFGFRKEGILKEAEKLSDDCYHDMVLYAILKKEWRMLYDKNIRSKI